MTNSNDMPDKSYDFLAPIGQYGQIREPYHLLRRTAMFLHDWAKELAPMKATFPDVKVTKTDATDLRWAVRSDGKSGFVFVNNYQRGLEMPAKEGVQFALTLAGAEMKFPEKGMTVPADSAFFIPFNMPVEGNTLRYATAQPVCKVSEGNVTTMVFAEIPGVPAEFAFLNPEAVERKEGASGIAEMMYRVSGKDHTTEIFVVDAGTSLRTWRANVRGKERILITPPGETLYSDGKSLTLQTTDSVIGGVWGGEHSAVGGGEDSEDGGRGVAEDGGDGGARGGGVAGDQDGVAEAGDGADGCGV